MIAKPFFRSKIFRIVAVILVLIGVIALWLNRIPLTSRQANWHVKVGNRGNSYIDAPVIATEDRLFVAAMDRAPKLYPWEVITYIQALDRKDGSFIWHAELNGFKTESMLLSGNMIFATSRGGSLYGLDATTGQSKWSALSLDYWVSNLVEGEKNIILAFRGRIGGEQERKPYVIALDRETGAIQWQKELPGQDNEPQIYIKNGLVILLDGDTLLALDATTGTVKWRNESLQWMPNAVCIDQNIIALTWTNSQWLLAEIEVTTGIVGTIHKIDTFGLLGRMACQDNFVFLINTLGQGPESGGNSNILMLDTKTGNQKTLYQANTAIWRIQLLKNRLYLTMGDYLQVISANSGKNLWHFQPSTTLHNPTPFQGYVYIGDWNGQLYEVADP